MQAATVSPESVQKILSQVKYPGFSRDIVSFGLVRDIQINNHVVSVALEITTSDPETPLALKKNAEEALLQLGEEIEASVTIVVKKPNTPRTHAGEGPVAKPSQLQKVKYAIAVASGKGGVGKSTVAVNLACAFESIIRKKQGVARIGLMDCDIYGPSMPLMIGLSGRPEIEGDNIIPLENFGVRVISMGFLIDDEAPVVWRGPMIMKTIQQFATNVAWGELDVLVIDLPPGTGDAQLSLVQTIPLDGAVIVTTPQAAAVNVARRGARMFGKVNVPLLGVIENMSYLQEASGNKNHLFGQGGGGQAAKDLETSFLGQIPLDAKIREGGDHGIPIVVNDPQCLPAKTLLAIAEKILNDLETR